jgi:hypothetical protein
MNSLREESGPEAVEPHAGDYFIVSGDCGTWLVSTEMARFIESILDARPRARWVKFVDLAGSRVRVRTRLIEYICQCSAEQRASDRALSRALKRERKADRTWEEDE